MIVLLEEPESWSLMMLVSAVAIDNADISFEGKEGNTPLALGAPGGHALAGGAHGGPERSAECRHR